MKLAMRALVGIGVGIGAAIGLLPSLAPETAYAQDARAVVQAAATAMGANNLKTIQMTGAGWTAAVGQSYNLTNDWNNNDYLHAFDREIPSYAAGPGTSFKAGVTARF